MTDACVVIGAVDTCATVLPNRAYASACAPTTDGVTATGVVAASDPDPAAMQSVARVAGSNAATARRSRLFVAGAAQEKSASEQDLPESVLATIVMMDARYAARRESESESIG